jgi:hypothetical protein
VNVLLQPTRVDVVLDRGQVRGDSKAQEQFLHRRLGLAIGEFAAQVAEDQEAERRQYWVHTEFFVNGVFIGGAQPVAEFQKVIDNGLKSA